MNDRDNGTNGASARARMFQLVGAVPLVQAIHVVARLGIADSLSGASKSADELAREVGAHGPSLRRLLRFLTDMDIFAEDADGRFSLTPLAAMLQSGVPGSIRQLAVHVGEDWTWRAWGELHHTVMTGEPAFDKAHGMPYFDYLAKNPPARASFDEFMTELSAVQIPAIVSAYDFSPFRKIVDVGGGHGGFLTAILAKNPTVTGVLYDVPEVAKAAAALVPDRIEVLSGDFFESVPPGGDAYVLKWILHDWSDAHAVRILKSCRAAIGESGTLLVVDMVVPEQGRHESKAMDVIMMAQLRGRERTEAELRSLLQAAGFRLSRLVPTESRNTIIECKPEL